MEIDEDKQTGRKYIKMIEDEDSDTDEDLIKDINKIKQGVSAKEELGLVNFTEKMGLTLNIKLLTQYK